MPIPPLLRTRGRSGRVGVGGPQQSRKAPNWRMVKNYDGYNLAVLRNGHVVQPRDPRARYGVPSTVYLALHYTVLDSISSKEKEEKDEGRRLKL